MGKYDEMSDFEVNKAVAINRGGYCGHVEHMEHGVKEADRESNGLFYTERDYCNNPADAYPIIFSDSIATFETLDGEPIWVATTNLDKSWLGYGTNGFDCYHKNPLRAAMIVYLMMQEAANG